MILKLKPIDWITLALMAVLVTAAAIGSGTGLALIVLGVFICAFVVFFLIARFVPRDSDEMSILTGRKDERQNLLDFKASYWCGMTALVLCVVAAAIDLASGGSGWPYSQIVAASGVVYLGMVLTARFRT